MSKYGVFSDLYFPAFGLNTERYWVSLRIQSECRKIRTRKNSEFGYFPRSAAYFMPLFSFCINWKHQKTPSYLMFSANKKRPLAWNRLTKHFCDCSYQRNHACNWDLVKHLWRSFLRIILSPFKSFLISQNSPSQVFWQGPIYVFGNLKWFPKKYFSNTWL